MIDFNGTMPVLKAADIRTTVNFYVQILGFTVDTLWPEEQPTMCILDRGDAHLMFDTNGDWDAPGSPPTMTGQLVFEVSDATALHDSIRDKIDVLWGPEVYPYRRREFSIKDPNGYRLVFSERTSDPPTCDG